MKIIERIQKSKAFVFVPVDVFYWFVHGSEGRHKAPSSCLDRHRSKAENTCSVFRISNFIMYIIMKHLITVGWIFHREFYHLRTK